MILGGPLTFDIHDSVVLIGTVYQPGAPPGLSVPQNITNWSITFDVYPAGLPASAIKRYSVGSGITIPIGTDGRYEVSLPNADIVALANNALAPLGLGGRVRLLGYVAYRTDAGSEAGLSRGPLTIGLS
jgi:hypothetical protein